MRVTTFGKAVFNKSMFFITREDDSVTASFASNDGIQNAAHVTMSKSEATELAKQLLAYVSKE